MGEHLPCKQRVEGSNPSGSTTRRLYVELSQLERHMVFSLDGLTW